MASKRIWEFGPGFQQQLSSPAGLTLYAELLYMGLFGMFLAFGGFVEEVLLKCQMRCLVP